MCCAPATASRPGRRSTISTCSGSRPSPRDPPEPSRRRALMIRVSADVAPAQLIAALDRYGAVIIDRALSAEALAPVARELGAELDATPAGEGEFFGYRTVRCGGVLASVPSSQALALDPRVLAVMDHYLLPNCQHYQLNLSQAIRIEPGERGQILHADDAMFPLAQHSRHEFMINAMWAVSDFTDANGATRLQPGSHRGLIDPDPPALQDRPEMAAVMPAGSVLIYLGSTQHGGGANRSDAARTGLVFSYCLGWLRQSENQYLTYPPEVARNFPPDLQRLIGYRVHEPNLGWVKGEDPARLLAGDMPLRPATRDFIGADNTDMVRAYYAEAGE
ncbi:hypothetical protein CKO24_10840 [Rhodothalassium salexigens DSM 2132]|nr:hypothetical protein [Rhodothalassium salexigens DSM 2132]